VPSRPRVCLEDFAIVLGREWATDTVAALSHYQRAICGGWPGTVTEASRLLVARMNASSIHPQPEPAEMSRLARLTYTTAKAEWLARADRESEDPDEMLD
jgi:hypothetical protein